MASPNLKLLTNEEPYPRDLVQDTEFEEMLYARNVEVESMEDLASQRGTPIPALFNTFYKFIQNPSTVSVETFKRMIDTDDTIGAGVDLLVTCQAARLGAYQHPNQEIQKFVHEMLDRIDGGFEAKKRELLSAAWAGFAVMETVWVDDSDLGWVPRKLVSLPQSTILFETERTGELTRDGILQYQRNYNPYLLGRGTGMWGGTMVPGSGFVSNVGSDPDPLARYGDMPFPLRMGNTFSYMCIRIPRAKCIHYSFNGNGNPYGRSMLRRIYKYYVLKDTTLRMMATALDRKGTPLTVIWADPNTTLESEEKNQTGANPREKNNQGMRADEAARKAFANIHNDSVVVLPGKKGEIFDVDTLTTDPNTDNFLEAIKFYNSSITRGLLLPALIMNTGDGSGSYSLGQEHAKTFDKVLDSNNAGLENCLIQQLIAPAVRMNFPESAWKKDGFGSFGKREMSAEEVQKELEALEKGVNLGAVDMNDVSDLNVVRDKIKLEPRTKPIDPPVTPFGDEEGNDEFAPPGTKAEDNTDGNPEGKKR